MNILNIYLKLDAVGQSYDFYINGVRSNSNYKVASQAIGLITPQKYLESMAEKLKKHVLVSFKSYCQDLMFYSGTQTYFETWAKQRNLLPSSKSFEIQIQGLSEDGKSVVDYTYVADEGIKEAILEAERLPTPSKEDWICN